MNDTPSCGNCKYWVRNPISHDTGWCQPTDKERANNEKPTASLNICDRHTRRDTWQVRIPCPWPEKKTEPARQNERKSRQ